ncbi:MAG: molybdopterin-dependent oxidoreductase [Dehalococcoidia bacterium]
MTSENRVSISIDGQQIRVRPGAMALDVAIEAGVYIPYLCYHPCMKPFAACRMCVVQEEVEVDVEREGWQIKEKQLRPPTASCTLPVREGMVIWTATESVRQLQRGIMEMLISEHPHGCLTCHRIDLCGPGDICLRHVAVNDRCVVCPKNERCELKDSVRFFGMDLNSPLSYRTRELDIEAADPFYDRDYNLCILCGRCVRVCEEVRGDNALCFTERAGKALVGTSQGMSLLESGCEFCGACVDVCPVGALVEREHKWDKAVRVERTVCPHCAVGCQLNLEIDKRERVIRSIPEINAPPNRGQACFKGKFGLEYANSRERLKRPMIRRDGELKEATWEEALDYIAGMLPQYKGKGFAAIASARCTNESAYILQKFARTVMESGNVDVASNTRPALTRALADSLGYAASTNSTWELEEAECILTVDTNTTEEHTVLGVPIKRAAKKGAKLIVIDAREVELTRYAYLWLRPRPGTTLTLLGGILRLILDHDRADVTFIQDKCEGFDELRASLEPFGLDSVAQMTGIQQDQIQEAALIYAAAETAAIVYALDNVSQDEQISHVRALADLALVTGNIGKPAAGLYALRHGTNEQGATDVGCAPDQPGLGVVEAFRGAQDGTVKAMVLLGDSPGYGNGEASEGYEALENLEFLVVQDSFMSAAAQRAHVVLPGTTFVEENGTFTNLERRVQHLSQGLIPRNSEVQPAWLSLCQLAKQMNVPGFDFETAAQVFDEIAIAAPIYGGISHKRLQEQVSVTWRPDPLYPQPTQFLYSGRVERGIQWPCYDKDTPGSPVLYTEGFPRGRAKLMPLEMPTPTQEQAADGTLLFVPGRVLAQSDRSTEVALVGGVNRVQREEVVEIHGQDAADLGIEEGETIEVVLATERLRGIASLSEKGHRGVISMTTLFGELAIQLQASEDPDPMAKVPGLVIRPARVEKVTE